MSTKMIGWVDVLTADEMEVPIQAAAVINV